jgi:hypothetical protein
MRQRFGDVAAGKLRDQQDLPRHHGALLGITKNNPDNCYINKSYGCIAIVVINNGEMI